MSFTLLFSQSALQAIVIFGSAAGLRCRVVVEISSSSSVLGIIRIMLSLNYLELKTIRSTASIYSQHLGSTLFGLKNTYLSAPSPTIYG